jgi:hypothetical protein
MLWINGFRIPGILPEVSARSQTIVRRRTLASKTYLIERRHTETRRLGRLQKSHPFFDLLDRLGETHVSMQPFDNGRQRINLNGRKCLLFCGKFDICKVVGLPVKAASDRKLTLATRLSM